MSESREGKRPRCGETGDEKHSEALARVVGRLGELHRAGVYGVLEVTLVRGRITKLRTVQEEHVAEVEPPP